MLQRSSPNHHCIYSIEFKQKYFILPFRHQVGVIWDWLYTHTLTSPEVVSSNLFITTKDSNKNSQILTLVFLLMKDALNRLTVLHFHNIHPNDEFIYVTIRVMVSL